MPSTGVCVRAAQASRVSGRVRPATKPFSLRVSSRSPTPTPARLAACSPTRVEPAASGVLLRRRPDESPAPQASPRHHTLERAQRPRARQISGDVETLVGLGSHSKSAGQELPADVARHPVTALLRSCGLERYAEKFLRSGFDEVETLADMVDSDLKDLGVPAHHAARLRRRLLDGEQHQGTLELEIDRSKKNAVTAFLETHGLGEYSGVFLAEDIDDMETLLEAGESDLAELGLSRGHALKLQRHLCEYLVQHTAEHGAELGKDKRCDEDVPTTGTPSVKDISSNGAVVPLLKIDIDEFNNTSFALPTFGEQPTWQGTEAMKVAVVRTWDKVLSLGTLFVGRLLCRHTFALSPDMNALFPPHILHKYQEAGDLDSSGALARHFGMVLNAVGCVISSFESDVNDCESTIMQLGMRHASYRVVDGHFETIGRALELTLQEVLKDEFTQEVRDAWKFVYSFLSLVMIRGIRSVRATWGAA